MPSTTGAHSSVRPFSFGGHPYFLARKLCDPASSPSLVRLAPKEKSPSGGLFSFGAPWRDRTSDLHNVNVTLYH